MNFSNYFLVILFLISTSALILAILAFHKQTNGEKYIVTSNTTTTPPFDPGPPPYHLYAWSPIKNMLVPRDWHASVSAKGIVFVIGGMASSYVYPPEIATVEGYTPIVEEME